jgi:AmmeMemoRadiSam system protein A
MVTSMPELDESARRELLALSRATLAGYFQCGRVPELKVERPELLRGGGAFVSLHHGEDLRGCIGILSNDGELYRTVQRCVLSAALEDDRFHPVTLAEIDELKIEVSVLSEFQRISDPQLIEVGRHGLLISLGGSRGLLLPQVAAKHRWDRKTFLTQTCRKAGLPAEAWQQPNTVIQIFEAQVFSE